jgi:hypothetical protein
LLGVLLCYNDADFLVESIESLRESGHHVIAWDHGSNDETPRILRKLRGELVEVQTIPRSFDFYKLYPEMSRHLIDCYADKYQWFSWPDQDEILEGPDRSKTYREWLDEVIDSPYDWVEFRNFNFWWTSDDDPTVTSVVERVRHYALFGDCPPRIRSWRSSATNERIFNHNPPLGERFPTPFNLRHYPMRSEEQMVRRLEHDRVGLASNGSNYHYQNMSSWRLRLTIPPGRLHKDTGGELDDSPVFDWRWIYGDERSLGAARQPSRVPVITRPERARLVAD